MVNVDLNLADLSEAHTAIAGAITATEGVMAELAKHAKRLPPGTFDELVRGGHERVAALRRVSNALFDAELELRFPA